MSIKTDVMINLSSKTSGKGATKSQADDMSTPFN